MSRQQRVIILYISAVLGLIGIVVFVIGIVVEYVESRTRPVAISGLSTPLAIALGGLFFAALMGMVAFGIVGWALARQTRQQGSGYGDAYRYIEAFRFRDAIPLLERSIKEGKETAEVLMLLTSAYAYSGQLAKAQAAADRAVALYPNDPDSYITLANGYRLQASYDEAANALDQAATLAPDNPIIWAEKGFVQRFAGDTSSATESFEHAATHAMPAAYCVRVFYHLAQNYQQEGDTKRAVKATARMMSARDGLATWRAGLYALEGTAYGQALRYEIAAIEQALADADAGNLG
jgi:tetratricopeptide (TPR) repeat protein